MNRCFRDYFLYRHWVLCGNSVLVIPLTLFLLLCKCWFCLSLDLQWVVITETFAVFKVSIKEGKKKKEVGICHLFTLKSNINKFSLSVYIIIFIVPVPMADSLRYSTSSSKYFTPLPLRFVHLIILFSGIGIPIISNILDNILSKSRTSLYFFLSVLPLTRKELHLL